MGMIGNLLRVTKKELEAYLEDSSLLESSLYDEETDEENPNLRDIDKAWEGILFLLTGQNLADADHPLANVVFGEQVIDVEQDLGYGPAHYSTPEQVANLNSQISKITVADLKKRYNPKRMMELGIYPEIWEDEGNEAFDYLSENFETIKEVYSEATKNGEAIITFIN